MEYYWYKSEKLCFEPSQIATVTNCDNSGIPAVAICDLSQFVIKDVTAQTESNNTENVFWVLGRVPRFTFDMNMKNCIFAHFGVFWNVYLFLCISVIKSINDAKGNLLWIVLWVRKRVFCTLEYTVGYYWYKSEKLCFEPSQIATVTNCDNSGIPSVAICDLSQFVIRDVTAQTESNNTENVFWVLGRVPRFTFDINMKSCIFAHFGVISPVYMFMCVFISYKLIIDVLRKPSWKGPMLMWTCFVHLGVYPRILWNLSEKLCFEPSQIATVTNCDTTVAICDLSQFVIKAVTAQSESNNTENLFCVLGRVPMFTFDMNMKTYSFAHSGVISLVYLFVCMYISYKAHNRCTKETFLIESDVDVNIFSAKGNLIWIVLWVCKRVFCTWEYTVGYYWYKSEKLCFEPSQIATVTNCDNSGIPAVAICDLSQFVMKDVTAQTESNNTENVFWVLGRVPRFIFDMNMKNCTFAHFGVF